MLTTILGALWTLISYNNFQIPISLFHLLTTGSAG